MLWCRNLLSIVLGPALVATALAQHRAKARDMALAGYHDPQGHQRGSIYFAQQRT